MKNFIILIIALIINLEAFCQSNRGLGIQYVPGPDMTEYYNLELELLQQRIDNDRVVEELLKKKALERMKETKQFYNFFSEYPTTIPNGWHNAKSMNNRDMCEEVKVFVEGNKIKKYFIQDWKQINIALSSPINKGKGLVQLKLQDGSQLEMVDVYFLENLSNPNSRANPPKNPGKVSFYSSNKRSGNIGIFIDDSFEGTIKYYFAKKAIPDCGQDGTLTIQKKPGTYTFKAVSSSGEWTGKIVIKENSCNSFELNK
jgi:hypothetical protein